VGGQDQANLGLHTNEMQLNICANSASSVGFFFSGIVKSPMCQEGFKTCREWCGDTTSSQYRHAAYGDGGGRSGGTPASCSTHLLLPEPIGMHSREAVTDDRLTASSERAGNLSARHARLNGWSFWSPATLAASEYIQVEFESEEPHVLAVAIQGGCAGGNAQYASLQTFKLAVTSSARPTLWQMLKDPDGQGDAVLSTAPSRDVQHSTRHAEDCSRVVLVKLNRPEWRGGLVAKGLRLYPCSWTAPSPATFSDVPVDMLPALRFEVYRGVCRGVQQQGVAYGQSLANPTTSQLVSVGVRNGQMRCRAGWSGNGVECSCGAASEAGVLAYWRFEVSADTSNRQYVSGASETSSNYWHVPDASSAHGLDTQWYDQTGGLNTRNDLQIAARGAVPADPSQLPVLIRPSLEASSSSSSESGRGPRNIPWAVLCLENRGHLALPGSHKASVGLLQGLAWGPFLSSLPHAAINSATLSSFTVEISMLVSREHAEDVGQLCLLDRPSQGSDSSTQERSRTGSWAFPDSPSRYCPSFRLVLTPSNRVEVTWSNHNKSTCTDTHTTPSTSNGVWKLAGRTQLQEGEWHRIVVVGDAQSNEGRGSCALYVFRAEDRGWRHEAQVSPCDASLFTPSPSQRWLVGACSDLSGIQGFFPGFLDEIRVSYVALPQHRWLWVP